MEPCKYGRITLAYYSIVATRDPTAIRAELGRKTGRQPGKGGIFSSSV